QIARVTGQDVRHPLESGHWGVDGVRMDRVNADSVFADLESQCIGEPYQPVFGGGVVAVARSGFDTGRRTHNDDGASVARLDHRRHRGADGAPGAVEVDVDDGVPLFLGHLPEAVPT